MANEVQLSELTEKDAKELTDKILRLAEILGETTFYPYQRKFASRIIRSVLLNEGATITALFSRQCIAEGTCIYSPDGQILPIEKSPSAWKTGDSADVLSLCVEGGHKITCTPNHPLYTENGWIAAGDLKRNDRVAVLSGYDAFGDGIIPYTIDSVESTFNMTEEFARILGTICPEVRGRNHTYVTKNPAKAHELIGRQFHKVVTDCGKQCKVDIEGQLFIFLKYLVSLDKYGFPRNLHHFTREQLLAFLQPIFENHSSLHRGSKYFVRIRLGRQKQFLSQLRMVLLKFGIQGNIEVYKKKWSIVIPGYKNIQRVNELFGYPNSSYVKLSRNPVDQGYKQIKEETGEEFTFRPLRSIEKTGQAPVWDMEVPGKGWFVANGVKVHNSGKCMAKGTEVVMWDGSTKKVEDITVEDRLLTPDSKSVGVVSLTSGVDRMYKVTPRMKNQQDAAYTVNSSHILSLYNIKTKEIEDISIYQYLSCSSKDNYRGIRVSAEFPKRDVFAEPYFLGLWLGDGDARDVRITNVDQEVISYLQDYASRLGMSLSRYSQSYKSASSYAIVSSLGAPKNKGFRINRLREYMESLHLFDNKHIPDQYLFNSYESRLQLLAGLIDSDGSLDKHQIRYEISCSNDIMAPQIVYLARSLGFQVTLSKRTTTCNGKAFHSNRIVIYGDISKIPVRISRKKTATKPKRNPLLYRIDIEEIGIGEYYGFTLDNEEKRFLLNDFTITHNSQTVAMVAAALCAILPMLSKKYTQLAMYKKGFWIGIFGPINEQAVTLFERINDLNNTETAKEIFNGEFRMPIPKMGGKQGNTIKYDNGSIIRMHSAAPRSKIESKTYHFILLDECVSGDTEILTKDGWIRIDVWNGQEIAVLNSDFGMSYEVPKRYIKHDSVPLLTAKCKHGLEYTTTPGHNIVYTPTRNPMSIEKMQAEVFWKRGNGNCRAIRSGNLKDTYKLSYLERVGIMLNADGCKYNVKQNGDIIWKLEFSKKRKINRCKHLLTKAGIKYKEFEPRKFKNPKWNDSVKIVFTLDATDYKQSFRNWLPYNCGSDFINELLYWDGYRCKKTREYDSTDKSNVEFVEQICVQNRIDCSAIRAIERKNKDHNTLYRLDMGWKNGFSFGRNDKDIEVKYDKAYCFETSTGMFFIRKNGVVLVTGNCQDITSFKIAKSISPMLSSVNGTTVATGTPDYYVGWFYNMIQLNKKHDVSCKEDMILHHEADYVVAQAANPYYRKYVAKEIKKLGYDSPEFMMAYRLFWPISRGMLFTKTMLEEKCYNKKIGFVKSYKGSPCMAGLDLGKTIDSTVLTILMPEWNNADEFGNMPKTILDWLEIEGDDWESQYNKICEKLENYWIDTLIVDATGLGDPVAERLSLLLPEMNVAPFVFTPSNKDTAYKYLIQEVANSRVIVPADKNASKTERFRKFENQMTMLKKEYQGKFLSPATADDKVHDDYCVDEETEILTERGFVSIDDIEEEDLVANFSLSDSTIYYKKPKRVIKKYYDGTMYDFIGKTVEQSVTENHRMLYYSDKLQDFNVQLSQDWYRRNTSGISYTKKIITTTIQDFIEEFPISDEEIQIAAWMITEGWITQSKSKGWNDARYQLGQSTKHNPKNVEEIDGIVKKLGLSYNEYLRTDGLKMWQFRKVSKPFFDSLLKDGVHTIPKEWLGKFSQRQLKLLFNTLMKGDGHRTPSSCYYYTKDMSLAQDFQELVFKIGYQATISKQDRNSGVIYNISVNLARKNGYVTEINTRKYNGRVWCVETDSGFIVIRKNNKISVTGNCSSLVLAVYATYFECMPEVNMVENDFFRSNKAGGDLLGRRYSKYRRAR
jgi:DNA-binding transcriptional regulator WhiA